MSLCTYLNSSDSLKNTGGLSDEDKDKLNDCYNAKHEHYNLSQRIPTTVTNDCYRISGSFSYYMVVNDICFANFWIDCVQTNSSKIQIAKLRKSKQSQTIAVPPIDSALEGSALLVNIGTDGYLYMRGGEAGKSYQFTLIYPVEQ